MKYNLPYLFYLYLPKIFSILFIPIIKSNIKTVSISEEGNISLKKYHLLTIIKNKKKMLLLFYIISFLEVIQEYGDCLLYYYQRIEIEDEENKIIRGWLIEKKNYIYYFCSNIMLFFIRYRVA